MMFNSVMVLQKTCFFVILIMTINILIASINKLRNRENIKNWGSIVFLVFSVLSYYKGHVFISSVFNFLSIISETYFKNKFEKISSFNILPIDRKSHVVLLPIMLVTLTSIFYMMDLSNMEINILMHIILASYIIFLFYNIQNKEKAFKEIQEYYTLSTFIFRERDLFSQMIHDEIIQNIRASTNLLSLKQADVKSAKKILIDLEVKLRKLMNFYSNYIFLDFSFQDNLNNVVESIKTMYPHKNIKMEVHDNDDIFTKHKSGIINALLPISKELIGNVFKHSRSSYIIFNLERHDESKIRIICESDGASQDDFKKINNSVGGVLLVKILVKKCKGNIKYELNRDILRTTIDIDLEEINESAYI